MNLNKLKAQFDFDILINERMSNHTSYGIGGSVLAYIRPNNKNDLIKIIKMMNKKSYKTYYLGSGSNLLVNDKNINAFVITTARAIKDLKITNNIIYADSGVMLGKLVKESMKHKLTGLESLAGVPGTLGGALKMNAGAWGSEISNYLTSVEIVDIKGEVKTLRPIDLNFGYRNSSFSSKDFILSAQFKLESSSKEDIKIKKAKASDGRKKTQPLKYRSAGSVFKNPHSNLAAGFLIEKAGLKGTKYGDAEISTHHANFFINHGSAKASDVAFLIRLSRKTVYERYGIMLDLELRTIGFKNNNLFPNA
ncbi:MAG: UDP-N-acetylmuramate dehydrogenase [Candidatus Marinimicrobia bacterium]|nr:UDP-N-acetylmuramate dehydrogenase [Candidatus Neomarinimicrobiota bacterium]